jgi:hypothetical protein
MAEDKKLSDATVRKLEELSTYLVINVLLFYFFSPKLLDVKVLRRSK